jgi:hypothetical protein
LDEVDGVRSTVFISCAFVKKSNYPSSTPVYRPYYSNLAVAFRDVILIYIYSINPDRKGIIYSTKPLESKLEVLYNSDFGIKTLEREFEP